MTEDLMESVAPQLAPPVTRQPAAAATTQDGVYPSIITIGPITVSFAADEDE
jgi:hypothetical protein